MGRGWGRDKEVSGSWESTVKKLMFSNYLKKCWAKLILFFFLTKSKVSLLELHIQTSTVIQRLLGNVLFSFHVSRKHLLSSSFAPDTGLPLKGSSSNRPSGNSQSSREDRHINK